MMEELKLIFAAATRHQLDKDRVKRSIAVHGPLHAGCLARWDDVRCLPSQFLFPVPISPAALHPVAIPFSITKDNTCRVHTRTNHTRDY